jgi:hypothetical protein
MLALNPFSGRHLAIPIFVAIYAVITIGNTRAAAKPSSSGATGAIGIPASLGNKRGSTP